MSRILALVVFFASPSIWAWGNHAALTRMALKSEGELKVRVAEFRPFSELLADLGLNSEAEFNESLLIDREFRFEDDLALNEQTGSRHTWFDVLSTYADEPDRKYGPEKRAMDISIYDQYPDNPEIQKKKEKYVPMFGDQGTPSQFFRHGYMPPFSPLYPVATFRIDHSFENIGEAHERTRIFFALARQALEKGHDYWALRLMSNGLHYLEDVSSLFHTRRVVSLKYITAGQSLKYRKYYNGGFKQNLQALITYHHWIFEDFIGRHLGTYGSDQASRAALQLEAAISPTGKSFKGLQYQKGDEKRIEDLVKNLANYSLKNSDPAARATWDFFPDLIELDRDWGIKGCVELDAALKSQDPDVNFYENPRFWDHLMRTRTFDSSQGEKLLSLVREVFGPQGEAIRALLRAELGL